MVPRPYWTHSFGELMPRNSWCQHISWPTTTSGSALTSPTKRPSISIEKACCKHSFHSSPDEIEYVFAKIQYLGRFSQKLRIPNLLISFQCFHLNIIHDLPFAFGILMRRMTIDAMKSPRTVSFLKSENFWFFTIVKVHVWKCALKFPAIYDYDRGKSSKSDFPCHMMTPGSTRRTFRHMTEILWNDSKVGGDAWKCIKRSSQRLWSSKCYYLMRLVVTKRRTERMLSPKWL